MDVSKLLSTWSSLQHYVTALIKGLDHIMLFSCDVYGLGPYKSYHFSVTSTNATHRRLVIGQ